MAPPQNQEDPVVIVMPLVMGMAGKTMVVKMIDTVTIASTAMIILNVKVMVTVNVMVKIKSWCWCWCLRGCQRDNNVDVYLADRVDLNCHLPFPGLLDLQPTALHPLPSHLGHLPHLCLHLGPRADPSVKMWSVTWCPAGKVKYKDGTSALFTFLVPFNSH